MRKRKRQILNKVVSIADNKVVLNNRDQKAPQVAPSINEVNNPLDKERKDNLESELQGYRYSQSSKFSSVSRTLILGIIGTIWAIILKSENGSVCHPLLTTSLLLAIAYLVCDVQHYYQDSKNYFERQFQLDKAATNADLERHDSEMDDLSKKSQNYVKWKYRLLRISVMAFILGIIDNFYLSDALLNYVKGMLNYCISSL